MSTPLTLYGMVQANPDTLTTSARIQNVGGGSITSNTTLVGTATGYGELWPLGNAGAWTAGTTLMNTPDGNGFMWDVTTLEGQQLLAGSWSAINLRMSTTVGTLSNVGIYLRAYVRHSNGTYTQIGATMSLLNQSIGITPANYNFAPVSQPSQNFNTGDKFYFQVELNIGTNGQAQPTLAIKFVVATGNTLGSNNCRIITPGYQPQPPGQGPDNPYGVTVGTNANPQNTTPLNMQNVTDLQNWGNGCWLRYQLRWSTMEGPPGTYNWNWLDDAVGKCNTAVKTGNNNAVNILLPVQSCPDWFLGIDASGNYVSPSTLTTAVTAGVSTASIHIVALKAGSNLANGSTLTIGVENTSNRDQVYVSGNYTAGATTITVFAYNNGNPSTAPWIPAFSHAANTSYVVCADFNPNNIQPPNVPNPYSVLAAPADFAAFCALVAARYNGTVPNPDPFHNGFAGQLMYLNGIQIGNEDYDTFAVYPHGGRDGQGTLLGLCVLSSYPAIRAASYGGYIASCAVRKTPLNGIQHITNYEANFWAAITGSTLTSILADTLFARDFHYYRNGVFFLGQNQLDPTIIDPTGNAPTIAQEIQILQAAANAAAAAQSTTYKGSVWCCEFGWCLFNSAIPPPGDTYYLQTPQVDQPTQRNYTWKMWEAMRSGGAGKGMIFSDAVGSVVNPAPGDGKLPYSSPTDPVRVTAFLATIPFSIFQLVNPGQVPTYMLAYSDPSTQGLTGQPQGTKEYIFSYPSWTGGTPPPPGSQVVIVPMTRRDGLMIAPLVPVRRDGLGAVTKRRGS